MMPHAVRWDGGQVGEEKKEKGSKAGHGEGRTHHGCAYKWKEGRSGGREGESGKGMERVQGGQV